MKMQCKENYAMWLALAILLLALGSTSVPTAGTANQGHGFHQIQRTVSTRSSDYDNAKSRSYPSHVSFNPSINKRMMPGFRNPSMIKLKMIHFSYFTTMVPIKQACGFLENFFSTIASKAEPGGEWGGFYPEKTHFDIIEGNFRLTFICQGDTIPWTFVKSIADRLWETAALGLTNLFEMVYADDGGRIAVKVALTLVHESVGSASGSGSGSAGDREGSVPSGYTGPARS